MDSQCLPYSDHIRWNQQESVSYMSLESPRGPKTPSPRLNDTVNRLPEGMYQDVLRLLRVKVKKPKYLELIEWHRGRHPYDILEEKAAFEGYNLESLRENALNRLDASIAELMSGLPAPLVAAANRMDGLTPGELTQALETIREAKAHAVKRCYLERLVRLIELEIKLVGKAYAGSDRDVVLQACEEELRQAHANIELAPRVAHYRAEYIDKVKEIRDKTGLLDMDLLHAYRDSESARLDVSSYPPLLMSEKLLLDEVLSSLSGDVAKACSIAEGVWLLDQQAPFLNPPSRAKLMVRLNEYYNGLGMHAKAHDLISQAASLDPELPSHRPIYLIPFLVALIDWADDSDGLVSWGSALEYYERNEAFVLRSPVSGNRSRILIAMMAVYLGQNDRLNAQALFDNLYRAKDQKPPLYYRITGMLCHLMILFDQGEVAELKRNAKNYREFILEKETPLTGLVLPFIKFLQFNVRRYASPRPSTKVVQAYNEAHQATTKHLQDYQAQGKGNNRLLSRTCLRWLQLREI